MDTVPESWTNSKLIAEGAGQNARKERTKQQEGGGLTFSMKAPVPLPPFSAWAVLPRKLLSDKMRLENCMNSGFGRGFHSSRQNHQPSQLGSEMGTIGF